MALYGTTILKDRNRTTVAKSIVVYSDSGYGKSSLFKNAPSALYLNLENRLGHIEGELAEERIETLEKYSEIINKIKVELKTINRLKTILFENDKDALVKAKAALKDDFEEYLAVAEGKSKYIRLLVIDAMDDLYSMISDETCKTHKIKDLSELDRNQGYGFAKKDFLDFIREVMGLGVNVVMLCGITKAKEAWNTEGKDIPFLGSGSIYKALARKVTGVFAIDEEAGKRYIYTNPKNPNFFIKNSFDDYDKNIILPSKIELDFEEFNKWVKLYTDEEIAEWKKQTGLKKL